MMDILGPILWLVVALGILITFHEFGHFWVARRCGVRVLRFSVGFGPALWSRTAGSGTEYRIAAIPLGGYVKMLDEREGPVPEHERHRAFNRQSLGQRTAIVAAGPVFNLIFALAAFWLMFVVGIPETRPVVGQTSGIAAEAGLEEGDLIKQVGTRKTETWTHVLLGLIPPALDRRPTPLSLERPDGQHRDVMLELGQLGADFEEERALDHIGITPWQPDLAPLIGEVAPDTPAEQAGLRAGDRIVAIGGDSVSGWRDIARLIPEHGVDESGQPREMTVDIERNGIRLEHRIQPDISGGRPVIGIQAGEPDAATQALMERAFTILRHDPASALGEAFGETWRLTTATLGILGRMITGNASLSNLAGPITIAQMAHSSALLGFSRFLFFLGLISLSLAIINLLPIPMLDGGHLMYYLVELIKGSPVSEQAQIAGQYIGLMLVIALMSLAIFNDILRLIP
ncbi:RIP metalloprotease RseP [Wenzhouxiangella sp. AB-CW3]|uniref:RIP metalloprotease RseP n=1 Tax=Wenzhouxiangella sp. AB-CW3 TaxID=2771012 RepID=UPI00168AF42B|nr:RIP metalloprotease RseP [Wenzhouxiangella sp. AB-CW3]QOC23000.1 RIP metalloprotease RseP [Wenzhouxiangella sp. AB-CW3]